MSLRKKLLDTFGAQVSSDHERYPADVKCLGFLYLYVGRYPRNNASRNMGSGGGNLANHDKLVNMYTINGTSVASFSELEVQYLSVSVLARMVKSARDNQKNRIKNKLLYLIYPTRPF